MRCGGKTLLVRYLFLDIFPLPPFPIVQCRPRGVVNAYDTGRTPVSIWYGIRAVDNQVSLSYNLCLLCLSCKKHIVTYKFSASKSRKKETHISFIYNFSSKKRYFFEEGGGGACFWNFLFQNLIFIYIHIWRNFQKLKKCFTR